MKKFILIISFILIGCEKRTPEGYYCKAGSDIFYTLCFEDAHIYKFNCNKEKQAKFIIKCAEAANPRSDEEGEDLVEQCEMTSYNLFCEKEYLKK